jgi:hypothetical protein
MELDRLAHNVEVAVYGTVVAAGVLVATSEDSPPDAGDAAILALGTVGVLWLAHAWASHLGRRAAGAPQASFSASLAADWLLAGSTLPALGGLGLALLLGASDETAVNVGIWICVATLAVCGAVVGRRERQGPGRIIRTAGSCAALGLLLVVLESVVG